MFSYIAIKSVAFLLSSLLLVVEGQKTGKASNLSNAIIFMGGVFFVLLNPLWGFPTLSAAMLGLWGACWLGLILLFVLNSVPGGVLKTYMALIPWLSAGVPVSAAALVIQLCVIVWGALLLVFVIGRVLRRETLPMALPTVFVTVSAWVLTAL